MRCGWGDTSLELALKTRSKSLIVGCFLAACSIVFLVMDIMEFSPDEVMIALCFYDGLIVNTSIVIAYSVIYRRLKVYHEDLIEY